MLTLSCLPPWRKARQHHKDVPDLRERSECKGRLQFSSQVHLPCWLFWPNRVAFSPSDSSFLLVRGFSGVCSATAGEMSYHRGKTGSSVKHWEGCGPRVQRPVGAANLPATRLPRNVPPRTDIKYPTFRLITATILNHNQQYRSEEESEIKPTADTQPRQLPHPSMLAAHPA